MERRAASDDASLSARVIEIPRTSADARQPSGRSGLQGDADCHTVTSAAENDADPVGDALAGALEGWRAERNAPELRRALARLLAELAVLALVIIGVACSGCAPEPYGNEGVMGRRAAGARLVFRLAMGSAGPVGEPDALDASQAAAAAWQAAIPACNGIELEVTEASSEYSRDSIAWGWSGAPATTVVNISADGIVLRSATAVDPGEPWTMATGYVFDFREVLLHELGHALGLNHSSDPSAVMYASVHEQRELGVDDLERIIALYTCL